MASSLDAARAADDGHLHPEWGPFAPLPLATHVPIAGEVAYRFDPDGVEATTAGSPPSERTSRSTAATAWGGESKFRFHVTSGDWQESDQVLAGILTDFGSPHRAGRRSPGAASSTARMTGPFRRPRVEGRFTGEDMRAWDTLWGDGARTSSSRTAM